MGRTAIDYDRIAAEYARHRSASHAVLEALLAGTRLGPADRVLEIGCGTGDYLAAMNQAAGCSCVGVDPSREMVSRARVRAREAELLVASAEQLPFEDERFDFVFSVDVVHHVADPLAYACETFRVLMPGGRFCTVTDDEDTIRSRAHRRYFPETVERELERYPPIADLRETLTEAGFTALSEERTEERHEVTDAAAYRDKAFSSLHLISHAAFARGLARLEADLERGPIQGVEGKVLLWGTKP